MVGLLIYTSSGLIPLSFITMIQEILIFLYLIYFKIVNRNQNINFLLHVTLIIIKFIITILPVLVNVAFVTLLERKILGYSQLRLGPNKISFVGIIQPFSDAIKLFVKQFEFNSNVNWKVFSFAPVLILCTSLITWSILPTNRFSNS